MTRLFHWAADWIMHGPTVARTWPDNDPWDPPVRRAHLSDFGVPRPSLKNARFLPHKWDGSKVLRMPREVTLHCHQSVLSVTWSFCDSFFRCTLQQHSSPTSLRHWHDTRPVGTDLCHVFHWVRFYAVFFFMVKYLISFYLISVHLIDSFLSSVFKQL